MLLLGFTYIILYASEQTDIHTSTLIAIFRTPNGGEVTIGRGMGLRIHGG